MWPAMLWTIVVVQVVRPPRRVLVPIGVGPTHAPIQVVLGGLFGVEPGREERARGHRIEGTFPPVAERRVDLETGRRKAG